MAQKTIYFSDDEVGLFDMLTEVTGESVSKGIVDAVRWYLGEVQCAKTPEEVTQLGHKTYPSGTEARICLLCGGKWLIKPEEGLNGTWYPANMAGTGRCIKR